MKILSANVVDLCNVLILTISILVRMYVAHVHALFMPGHAYHKPALLILPGYKFTMPCILNFHMLVLSTSLYLTIKNVLGMYELCAALLSA